MNTTPPPTEQNQHATLTGPAGAGGLPASLETATSSVVTFQFNPGKVKITRSAKTEGATGLQSTTVENAVVNMGNCVISLDEVRFVGPTTRPNAETLLSWTVPVAGTTGAAVTDELWGLNAAGLPIVRFAWGSGLAFSATLTSVTINYQRFLPTGQPVRAECNISLQECVVTPTRTNPTSGGISGRRHHLVVADDNIVRIAQATYGTPANWRDIAEANDIDDPLRIRLGQRLFLPGTDELREKSQA